MFERREGSEPQHEGFWLWRERTSERLSIIENTIKHMTSTIETVRADIANDMTEIKHAIAEQRTQLTRLLAILSVLIAIMYFVGPRMLDILLRILQTSKP